MSINKDTVHKVARLARIRINEDEAETLTHEINGILALIAELDGANTDGVEPMTSVIDMIPHLRPDAVTDGGNARNILANAPEETADFFVVPKVVE